VFLIIK